MKTCDLHAHTAYSDGTFSPKELIDEAVKVGLSAIAVTDHNTIDAVEEFLFYADKNNIEGIAGVEFSTDYKETELHILALGIPKDKLQTVDEWAKTLRERKEDCNRKMIESLRLAGYDISYEEIRKTVKGTMNRAHIGYALYEKGYVSSVQEVFDTILSKEGKHYRAVKRLDVFETIRFIKSIGAIAVHAHPFLDLNEQELREFLVKAKECGLDGMETVYSTYDEETTLLAKKIAREFGLKESGGSDFHGFRKPHISLGKGMGKLIIPYEFWKNLKRG